MDDRIERPSYWDGQRLGARDFLDEQTYHADARRRHALGPHTWGIVHGLTLRLESLEGRPGEVDVTLTPGLAIDGYGRSIVVFYPYRLPTTLFADVTTDGLQPVWIEYREAPQRLEDDPCNGPQVDRVREEFRVVIGARDTDERPARGLLRVGDSTLSFPDPADLGDLPPDLSVPQQRFPAPGALWLVRLGDVRVDGSGVRFLETNPVELVRHRRLAGLVGGQLHAAEGTLDIVDRYRGPLTVRVHGALEVSDSGTFGGDVRLDGSSLRFRTESGGGAALALHRTLVDERPHLDLRLAETSTPAAQKPCFRVGPFTPGASGVIQPVLSVCASKQTTAHGPLRVDAQLSAASAKIDTTLEVGTNLTVRGSTELIGPVTAADTVEVADRLTAAELEVTGESDLGGDVRARNQLRVDGATDLRGTLRALDTATFEGTIDAYGPSSRRLVLGRNSAGTVAALGVDSPAVARYDAEAHSFYLSGGFVGSIVPGGLRMSLVSLDLDMRHSIASSISFTPSTTTREVAVSGAALTEMSNARQGIYVEARLTLTRTSSSSTWDTVEIQVQSKGSTAYRSIVWEEAKRSGAANDYTAHFWLPKPSPMDSTPLRCTGVGLGTGSTVTLSLWLIGRI
ncbi:MAG: hypothetical protein K8H88_27855 [Sandaracinaceae bacterium]|nr:hypothetical protein [Sandaracinaceae bacterium]